MKNPEEEEILNIEELDINREGDIKNQKPLVLTEDLEEEKTTTNLPEN